MFVRYIHFHSFHSLIDGTNQYVKGVISDPQNGIHPNGIHCAVVLLGVYSLSSGEPLLGVMNQPFYILNEQKEWKGRMVWGVAMGTSHVVYVPKPFGTKRGMHNYVHIYNCHTYKHTYTYIQTYKHTYIIRTYM